MRQLVYYTLVAEYIRALLYALVYSTYKQIIIEIDSYYHPIVLMSNRCKISVLAK